MKKLLWIVFLGAVAPACAQDAAPAIAAKLMQAMGGRERWQAARYLRFDWVVDRDGQEASRVRHLWDKHTGRYRVEWRSREGQAIQVLFEIGTRQGRVWVDGAAASDSTLLERAYGRFINDTYWLLMPWKLEDPGVRLEPAGTAELDGQTYDILHLSFASVGLTPGDHYWAYVNRATHRMDRWAYFLERDEGEPALERATAWTWSDWFASGGVQFARDRRAVGSEGRRIHFPVLALLEAVDPAVFEDAAIPLPEPAP